MLGNPIEQAELVMRYGFDPLASTHFRQIGTSSSFNARHTESFSRDALPLFTMEALARQSSLMAGCPPVIVAHMSDQFFWGSELERLGVAGPTLQKKGLTARALAKAISIVMRSPGTAVRARELGISMSRENGVSVAVEAIERMVLEG